MVRTLTDQDEGKPVFNATGEKLGTIKGVNGDAIEVAPVPTLIQRMRSRLGWGADERKTFRIPREQIDRIENDEIHLEQVQS